MPDASRPNIMHQLQNDIIKTDTLIDVGYGDMHDLIDFEHSSFKTIIGLDTQVFQPFRVYRNAKGINYDTQLHDQFLERFTLSEDDFTEYDFGINKNSLIICRHVLHFYEDRAKLNYLQRFYLSLQEGGLLYVRLNHIFNKDNTDPDYMNIRNDRVFQNKAVPDDIRYLIEPDDFLKLMRSDYYLLESHTESTEYDLTFVIKKLQRTIN